tara:strand:+ start:5035 stop:5451 length:417 start_codon:yes stop_codon:yes gene_type:complete
MQTFLPFPSFSDSAACLDRQRLGKQRVEAKQIYLALTDSAYGWKNHPAVKMWQGFESSLAKYGLIVCQTWIGRGYKDSLLPWFQDRISEDSSIPAWFGDLEFHKSHQSNLLRKNCDHYQPWFPDVSSELPYIWPINSL